VIERNQILLNQIKEIKTDHPLWGYRRIWSYLRYRQGIPVNKKRIYRLMKEENLSISAKNIKIIAVKGKVTLRGRVRTLDEEQSILSLARVEAGESNIINKLKIVKINKKITPTVLILHFLFCSFIYLTKYII
jgi:hypothetical protein